MQQKNKIPARCGALLLTFCVLLASGCAGVVEDVFSPMVFNSETPLGDKSKQIYLGRYSLSEDFGIIMEKRWRVIRLEEYSDMHVLYQCADKDIDYSVLQGHLRKDGSEKRLLVMSSSDTDALYLFELPVSSSPYTSGMYKGDFFLQQTVDGKRKGWHWDRSDPSRIVVGTLYQPSRKKRGKTRTTVSRSSAGTARAEKQQAIPSMETPLPVKTGNAPQLDTPAPTPAQNKSRPTLIIDEF